MDATVKKEMKFLSSDGKTEIAAYFYEPNTPPRGVIQLSHGMCEHVTRYGAVAAFFTENGFVFCGNDHIGHGKSAAREDDLGYLPHAADCMVEDIYKMTCLAGEQYPDLPIILLGHSMGSFVARLFAARHGDAISGLIVSGTAGPGQPTGAGRLLARAVAKCRGDRYRCNFLNAIAFGSYNKRFRDENDEKSWLSRDAAVRNAYRDDPQCGFTFTAAGFDTLFTLLGEVSKKEWAGLLPKTLPVLLISGAEDPVGGYGKGVRKVYDRLAAAGLTHLSLKLYEGARHEMHNETNRDEALADMLAFVLEVIA